MLEEKKNRKGKGGKYLEKNYQKLSRILRSLGFGFGLGLETVANFWRASVSFFENLVSEKKYRFCFPRIWSRKESIGFGFGKFSLGKKVSVSENLVSVKKSRYQFRSKFCYRHSVMKRVSAGLN